MAPPTVLQVREARHELLRSLGTFYPYVTHDGDYESIANFIDNTNPLLGNTLPVDLAADYITKRQTWLNQRVPDPDYTVDPSAERPYLMRDAQDELFKKTMKAAFRLAVEWAYRARRFANGQSTDLWPTGFVPVGRLAGAERLDEDWEEARAEVDKDGDISKPVVNELRADGRWTNETHTNDIFRRLAKRRYDEWFEDGGFPQPEHALINLSVTNIADSREFFMRMRNAGTRTA